MSGIIDTVGAKSGIVGSDVYPAGHIIQTVPKNFYGGVTAMAGTTWTPTYYIFEITPQRTSSKVLIQFSIAIDWHSSVSYTDGGGAVALFRDIGGAGYPAAGSPTFVFNTAKIDCYLWNTTTAEQWEIAGRHHFSCIDSPATTSVVTYKIYLAQWSSRSNVTVGSWSAECCSVLQEIAQ